MNNEPKILNNLIFQKVELKFENHNIENIFQFYKSKTLQETLKKPKYLKLNRLFTSVDDTLMLLPLGESLFLLKKANDERYKHFLNRNGDKKYCTFNLPVNDLTTSKGVYCYFVDGELALQVEVCFLSLNV